MNNSVSGQKVKKITDLVKSGEKTPKQASKELGALVKKEPSLRPEVEQLIDEWDIEDKEALRKYVRSRLIEKSLDGKDDNVQLGALRELTKFTQEGTMKETVGRAGVSEGGITVTGEGAQVLVAVMESKDLLEESEKDNGTN